MKVHVFPLIVCQKKKFDRNTVTNLTKLRDFNKRLDLWNWESGYKACPILYWQVSFICLFRIKFIDSDTNH